MGRRKLFGVHMLLQDKSPWLYCAEYTLEDALLTARTLRGELSLFPKYHVWIARVDQPAVRRAA